jgi:hypothetical protein
MNTVHWPPLRPALSPLQPFQSIPNRSVKRLPLIPSIGGGKKEESGPGLPWWAMRSFTSTTSWNQAECGGPVLSVVRYRGFVLIPQEDLTWLIRPERSPMTILPFRSPASLVMDVKSLIDWRLSQREVA